MKLPMWTRCAQKRLANWSGITNHSFSQQLDILDLRTASLEFTETSFECTVELEGA